MDRKEYVEIEEESSSNKNFIDIPPFIEWFDFFIDKVLLIIFILLLYYWNNKMKPSLLKISDKINLLNKSDDEISFILKEIQVITQASRVVYGLFHNGEYWGSGMSMLKLSVHLEQKTKGTSSIKNIVKDIPISLLRNEIDYMITSKDKFVFTDIKSPDILEGCKLHLENIGVEACYEFLICYKDETYGILAVQYTTNTFAKELSNVNFYRVKKLVNTIGYLIDKTRKESKNKDNIVKRLFN